MGGAQRAVEERVRIALPRFRLFWAGSCLAVLGLVALGSRAAAGRTPAGEACTVASALLAAAGVACGIAVLLLDARVLSPARVAAASPPEPSAVLRVLLAGHLALWSISVVPAILGLAQLAAGGSLRTHLLLGGISLGALAFLMPTRARIAARVGAALG